jgi:hypothetical protein
VCKYRVIIKLYVFHNPFVVRKFTIILPTNLLTSKLKLLYTHNVQLSVTANHLSIWMQNTKVIYFILCYNQQMHSSIIKVYIARVSLCNLHSYMFRHFRVTIRQFTTNALLSYIPSSNCSCWKYSL